MILDNDLKKADIIVKKRVRFTSGKTGDFYCDFKKVFGNPRLFKKITKILSAQIKGKATCVAATGYGGIPIAVAVSIKLNLPLTLIRSEKRTHGLKKQIEGYVPTAKDSVAVIEDVCTYGTSLIKVINSLKKTKTKISGCYVVVLRPETKLPFKYPLEYLVKAEELLE